MIGAERIADEAAFVAAFAFYREHEVEFGELDVLAHVNNVRYATWAETLRSLYFADVIAEDIRGARGIIMAKHVLQYDAPLVYRERVLIGQRITRWGTKSMDFETGVWSRTRGGMAFLGLATLVAYDYSAGTSIAIPPEWRERVAAFDAAASAPR